MKWMLVGILTLLAVGCGKRLLRCDGHLTPINAPATVPSPTLRAAPGAQP
jgi:hypothetical protein